MLPNVDHVPRIVIYQEVTGFSLDRETADDLVSPRFFSIFISISISQRLLQETVTLRNIQ